MRKREEALGEERLRIGGRDDAIGDDAVDELGSHRAKIAEPRKLNRGGPQREDLAAGMCRVPVEVDQQVDSVVADAPCRFDRGIVAAVDEVVERCLDPRPQRRDLARADGVGEGRELPSVVALPDLGCEKRDRVGAKVG